MKRHLMLVALVASLGLTSQVRAGGGVLLYSEDFNSVVLGDSVNERLGFPLDTVVAGTANFAPVPNAFTHTGPAGWTVDNNWNNFGNAAGDPAGGVDLDNPEYLTGDIVGNTGTFNQGDPNNGVAEWEGWSFANKDFWVEAAGGQDREQFTNGVGTVAVADGDEYDDLGTGRGPGYMNTGMTTGNIDVSSIAGQPFNLHYDSSWRPEANDDAHTGNPALTAAWQALDPVNNTGDPSLNNQTAVVWASYDGAAPVRLSIWDSKAGATFKGDATNEAVSVTGFVPGGTNNVQLSFGYLNASNDWWWAIDNLELKDFTDTTSLWSEDFEGVALGDSVNEQRATVGSHVTTANNDPGSSPRPNSFSHAFPGGIAIDNSLNPVEVAGDNNIGVFELEGWTVVTPEFWGFAGQGGGAAAFTNADGNIAVADGDEWDDFGDPTDFGEMNTLMETPAIALNGNVEDLKISFDSSWRDEDSQQVTLTVDFGDGPVEILHWSSDPADPDFHDDAQNESISIKTAIPAGATTAQYGFRYQGTNDWWWAIDNVAVSAVPEPTALVLSVFGLLGIGVAGRRRS